MAIDRRDGSVTKINLTTAEQKFSDFIEDNEVELGSILTDAQVALVEGLGDNDAEPGEYVVVNQLVLQNVGTGWKICGVVPEALAGEQGRFWA